MAVAKAQGKGAARGSGSKGARASILEAVNSAATTEKIQALVDGVFDAASGVKTDCPGCGAEVTVEVRDYKRIVDGLTALVQEAEGRPEQRMSEAATVIIERPPLA